MALHYRNTRISRKAAHDTDQIREVSLITDWFAAHQSPQENRVESQAEQGDDDRLRRHDGGECGGEYHQAPILHLQSLITEQSLYLPRYIFKICAVA